MPPSKADSPDTNEQTLLNAWLKSGGTTATYNAATPVPLSEYEEQKLATAGVKLVRSRPFFAKAKALMGERRFELLAAEEAERANVREERGREYGGLKPRNPTALMIGLVIHRIGELPAKFHQADTHTFPMLNLGTAPAPAKPAQSSTITLPGFGSLNTPQREARVRNRIEVVDAVQAASASKERNEIIYCSTPLVQASLPHANPGNVRIWSRHNGRKILTVHSGDDVMTGGLLGIPYGSLPRLMLYYIETQVIRNKSPRITLGQSLYAFTKALGISDSTQNYKALREQSRRLFNASFSLSELRSNNNEHGLNTKRLDPIARETEFWWSSDRDPNQSELLTSFIVLHDNFYTGMLQNGFPMDSRAVSFLKKSSLMLDLYAWVCHRNFILNRDGSAGEIHISYEKLHEQFGAEYSRLRAFNEKLKKVFLAIAMVWRGQLNYEFSKDGLTLKASPLQIDRV